MKFLSLLLFINSSWASPGVIDNKLGPCPDKPNCVSSMVESTDEHYVPPIPAHDLILDKLRTYISEQKRWKIVKDEKNYIHAIEKSAVFGFIDDVEFLLIDQTLHVKSASRTGYYDFKVNRERIEKIRDYLK